MVRRRTPRSRSLRAGIPPERQAPCPGEPAWVWGLVYLGNETNNQTTDWARNESRSHESRIRRQLGNLVAIAGMFHDCNVIFVMVPRSMKENDDRSFFFRSWPRSI